MTNDTKACNRCGQVRQLDGFHKQHTRPDGRRSICKECLSAQARPYLLSKRFGLSESDFSALLASQGNGCALCGVAKPGGRWENFHVDHCHETGKVRGILCYRCNVAIGQLGDNEAGMARALAYITGTKIEAATA
jgi:hypothetical protein